MIPTLDRPVLLDLFCGIGGAAYGYWTAGFDVLGVDVVAQPDYPFEFVQADAMTFPLDGYDVVHASPPCKAHTALWHRYKAPHDDLLTPTLARLAEHDGVWIVENVVGAPMPTASVVVCGSAFGLPVRRHRLFASNVVLRGAALRARDATRTGRRVRQRRYLDPHRAGRRRYEGRRCRCGPRARRALDVRQAGLSQAIPPAYTTFLGAQLREAVERPQLRFAL